MTRLIQAACRVLPTIVALSAAAAVAGLPSPPPSEPLAAQIDQSLAAETSAASSPSALARRVDDETFLRRVSLDLIGDLPTPEQVTAFVLDASPDKRAKAVDRLLASERFGENWARYFRDVILYRRSEERALLAGPAMVEFLAKQFNAGAGWDDIARALITAQGDVRENGSTGLIMAQMGQPAELAAETARIFLGVQIQCAQCHDHPSDRWKRKQFHELAAFFPRIAVRPVRDGERRSFEVVSRDVARPNRRKPEQGKATVEHYMPDLQDPAAEGTLMQPVFFVTGKKLPIGTKDADRRRTLADWITAKNDPWFARALVNRMWAELVGEGFYEPVDDLGPDRTCSAPKTLTMLSYAFINHDYDVKWLLRTITATAAYQRESRPRRDGQGTPFAANCPQPLRADQLYSALTAALGLEELDRPRPGKDGPQGPAGALRGPRADFNRTFGFDPSLPRDEVTGAIPQALLLMNAPALNRAINGRQGGTVLGKLLSAEQDDEAVATELYLRCLAREPTPDELFTCLAHVRTTANRSEAFEDVLWALINSTEFLHRK